MRLKPSGTVSNALSVTYASSSQMNPPRNAGRYASSVRPTRSAPSRAGWTGASDRFTGPEAVALNAIRQSAGMFRGLRAKHSIQLQHAVFVFAFDGDLDGFEGDLDDFDEDNLALRQFDTGALVFAE